MTTIKNPLQQNTKQLFRLTLNIYEIAGKDLAKTYVDNLKEHLDILGLKYKFEIVSPSVNEKMDRDIMPSLEQIDKTTKEITIVDSILSSIGLGESNKPEQKINNEMVFPNNYTGILTINLTIFENQTEPEKHVKAMDALAYMLNREIYGLEQWKQNDYVMV